MTGRRRFSWPNGGLPPVRGAAGVLELPVGTIDARGIAVGDRVEIRETAQGFCGGAGPGGRGRGRDGFRGGFLDVGRGRFLG